MSIVATFAAAACLACILAALVRRRRWNDPRERREMVMVAAMMLVAFVGIGRRIGVPHPVMDDLAGYAWTAVATAACYMLHVLHHEHRPPKEPK